MERITIRHLNAALVRINKELGFTGKVWNKNKDGKFVSTVGMLAIDSAYGSYKIVKMVSEGGAETDITGRGSAREILEALHAFEKGMTYKKNPRKLRISRRGVKINPCVRIVFNRLLNGWYIVRGPHQTPISGRFDSKKQAQAWLDSRRKPFWNRQLNVSGPMKKNPAHQFGKRKRLIDRLIQHENKIGKRLNRPQIKKIVCVEVQRSADTWHRIGQFCDTPEMRVLAKRFAKTYKRKHRDSIVRVAAY